MQLLRTGGRETGGAEARDRVEYVDAGAVEMVIGSSGWAWALDWQRMDPTDLLSGLEVSISETC